MRTTSRTFALFLACFLVVAPISLTGCMGPNSASTSSEVSRAIADAKLVVQGVSDAYDTLKLVYPALVTPALDNQVQTVLSSAPDLLAQLSRVTDAVSTASNLRGIESVVEQVLRLANSVIVRVPGVSPEVVLGFQVVTTLLPFIEMTANRLVVQAPRVGAVPVKFHSTMSVEQARARLQKNR